MLDIYTMSMPARDGDSSKSSECISQWNSKGKRASTPKVAFNTANMRLPLWAVMVCGVLLPRRPEQHQQDVCLEGRRPLGCGFVAAVYASGSL